MSSFLNLCQVVFVPRPDQNIGTALSLHEVERNVKLQHKKQKISINVTEVNIANLYFYGDGVAESWQRLENQLNTEKNQWVLFIPFANTTLKHKKTPLGPLPVIGHKKILLHSYFVIFSPFPEVKTLKISICWELWFNRNYTWMVLYWSFSQKHWIQAEPHQISIKRCGDLKNIYFQCLYFQHLKRVRILHVENWKEVLSQPEKDILKLPQGLYLTRLPPPAHRSPPPHLYSGPLCGIWVICESGHVTKPQTLWSSPEN